MKKTIFQRIVGLILTLSVMIFIFTMSSQNAETSSQTSGGVIKFAVSLVYPDFSELSEQAQNSIVSSMQGAVRSIAHCTIFALLCFSSLIFTLTLEKLKLIIRYFSSIIFSFVYAVSDEVHQIFIPGRAFQVIDILVDTIGIMLGAAVMFLIMLIIKKRVRR